MPSVASAAAVRAGTAVPPVAVAMIPATVVPKAKSSGCVSTATWGSESITEPRSVLAAELVIIVRPRVWNCTAVIVPPPLSAPSAAASTAAYASTTA